MLDVEVSVSNMPVVNIGIEHPDLAPYSGIEIPYSGIEHPTLI